MVRYRIPSRRSYIWSTSLLGKKNCLCLIHSLTDYVTAQFIPFCDLAMMFTATKVNFRCQSRHVFVCFFPLFMISLIELIYFKFLNVSL